MIERFYFTRSAGRVIHQKFYLSMQNPTQGLRRSRGRGERTPGTHCLHMHLIFEESRTIVILGTTLTQTLTFSLALDQSV